MPLNAGEVLFALIMGAIFLSAGLVGLRYGGALAEHFRRAGASMIGEKAAEQTYTPRNMKLAAIGSVVFGAILLGLGIVPFVLGYLH